MPSERFPPDDPREWLNRARSNLAYAKAEIPGVYYEERCFQAQQAAEKALKAVCLKHGILFQRTHNLVELIRTLEEHRISIPPQVRDALRATLTTCANQTLGARKTREGHQELDVLPAEG